VVAGAVKIAKDYTVENLELSSDSARSTRTTCRSSATTARWTCTTAGCARSTRTATIFDHVDNQRYLDYIAEEVRPWSYMKFPFIKSIGPGERLVPRRPARAVNTCDFIDTPEAEAAARSSWR
jgi:NAD-reducing hydrogenase large subunit